MFDYLQQFNKLSKDLRAKISTKEVMSEINNLEKKYNVGLAALIMKVMVKEVSYHNLSLYLVDHLQINQDKAKELALELKEKIFKDVEGYLSDSQEKQVNKEEAFEVKEQEKKKEEIKKNLSEQVKVPETKTDPQEFINEITRSQDNNNKIDEAIDSIIKESAIQLSSSYLKGRLTMALRTYIKGVRDKVSVRSLLARSSHEGGLGLDQVNIDRLLKLADKFKNKQEQKIERPIPKVSQQAEKIDKFENHDEAYDLKKELAKKQEQAEKEKTDDKQEQVEDEKEAETITDKKDKEDLYKKYHIQKEIAPPPPSVIKEKPQDLDLKKEAKEEKVETKEPPNLPIEDTSDRQVKTTIKSEDSLENKDKVEKQKEELKVEKTETPIKTEHQGEPKTDDSQKIVEKTKKKSFFNLHKSKDDKKKKVEPELQAKQVSTESSPVAAKSSKESMQDIKVTQRIMGPIDELRYFNLTNFRRLGDDPGQAFSKIRERIELLSKESYDKRVEAIQAWRDNPLNKLYQEISKESLDKSKSISDTVKARQEANQDYLSLDELKALIAFNKSFMY